MKHSFVLLLTCLWQWTLSIPSAFDCTLSLSLICWWGFRTAVNFCFLIMSPREPQPTELMWNSTTLNSCAVQHAVPLWKLAQLGGMTHLEIRVSWLQHRYLRNQRPMYSYHFPEGEYIKNDSSFSLDIGMLSKALSNPLHARSLTPPLRAEG